MCVYIYTYTHALNVQGSRKMLGVCSTWCGTELYVYIYIYQYIHIHRYICIYTYTHTHLIDTGIKESGWCVRHSMRHRSRYINTYIYVKHIHILYTYRDQGKWLVSAALDAAQSKIALRLAMDLSFQESGDDEARALYVRALKAQRRARYRFHYAIFQRDLSVPEESIYMR